MREKGGSGRTAWPADFRTHFVVIELVHLIFLDLSALCMNAAFLACCTAARSSVRTQAYSSRACCACCAADQLERPGYPVKPRVRSTTFLRAFYVLPFLWWSIAQLLLDPNHACEHWSFRALCLRTKVASSCRWWGVIDGGLSSNGGRQ